MLYTHPMKRDFLFDEAVAHCGLKPETLRYYLRKRILVPDGRIGRNNTFSKKALDKFKRWYSQNGRSRISTAQRAARASEILATGKKSLSQIAQELGYETSGGALKAIQRHRARLEKANAPAEA